MQTTPERSYSYEFTKNIALNFEKNESNITFETVCYKKDDYPTYVTYVKTKDGKMITRGNGKGIGKQSELSSIFEAIEHCFYESYFIKNNLRWKGIKEKYAKNIIKQILPLFLGNPIIENIKDYNENIKIPCKKFKSSFSDFSVYLPLYMCGPSYPRPCINLEEAHFVNSVYLENNKLSSCMYKNDSELYYKNFEHSLKYCSSVGGAAGIDFEETFLHALNEIIERDSTSEFLLRAIIKKQYDRYHIIDNAALDDNNQKIVNYIEHTYNVKVQVIDITGALGIPTILVFDFDNKYGKETLLTGAGTSLLKEYAIERALLEYKQTIDLVLYDKTLPKDDNFIDLLNQENVNNFFKELYYFDFKALIANLKKNDNSTKKNDLQVCSLNPKLMLKTVLDILQQSGYEVLYNDTVTRKQLHYVKVVIPQMCDITDPGPLRLPTKHKIEQILKDA